MKTGILQRKKIVTHIFVLMVSCITAFSQAPVNDNCTGAILVSTYAYSELGGVYTDVSTTGATRSTPDPSCTSSDNNDDVWYKFVAGTQVELLKWNTAIGGSNLAFAYALYDACGGTQIACNNYTGTFAGKELLGGLTPGNTYYLRLWSQYNFTYFSFSFCIQDIRPVTPSNEAITATELSINAPGDRCISPQFFTTAAATRSSPNPNCSSDNDDDVWFQFTFPTNSVKIITEQGVENNTGAFGTLGMEILDATGGYTISCTRAYPAGSVSLISGTAGHVYRIRIWGYGVGTSPVTFSMCLQQGYDVYPANDSCSSATELNVGNGSCGNPVTGNLANSVVTAGMTGNPSCVLTNPALANDVWYKFTVPATGNVIVQSSATHFAVNDLVMLAYTGTCGALSQIACDENSNPDPFPSANHARISLAGRTPGEIIYLRVVPKNIKNMGQFSICAFDETASAMPSISIVNAYKTEGNSGTSQLQLKVNLSNATSQQVQVSYATRNFTATAPDDYLTTSGVLTFAPGDTTGTINVTINGDATPEDDEAFKIKLGYPVNATIAKVTGYGAIVNDDVASLSSEAASEQLKGQKFMASGSVKIYPNPVSAQLNVEIPWNKRETVIQVYDMAGRLVKQLKLSAGQNKISIDAGNLVSGAYVVKIRSGTENLQLTFIKK